MPHTVSDKSLDYPAHQGMVAGQGVGIKDQKPSVLIMFTTQKDGFFDRLFGSSNSVGYSFLTTIPLLVFNKETTPD
jgi:hypothetical protein